MESPEKALDAGKHERTAIARQAEAHPVFGLHASFEAAWRPAHGEADGFRLRTQNTACSGAVANNPNVGARSRSEEKGSREGPLRKGQKRRGLETCKGGVLPRKLTEPIHTVYALEAEGQRDANKKVFRRFGAIKPQIALRPQGGALLQESAKRWAATAGA